GIADHQLSAAATTPQNASQQRRAFLDGSHLLSTVSVVRHHLLDLLMLFPANVPLMGLRYQCPPMLSILPPCAPPRFAVFVAYTVLRLAVCISTCVGRVAQNLMDGAVCRTYPMHFTPLVDNRKFQAVFQKP